VLTPSNRCPVCKPENKAQVHTLLASGMSYTQIEVEMRAAGRPIKHETISRHVRACLGGQRPEFDEATMQAVSDIGRDAVTAAQLDFATLVQRKATALLADGDLRVTATHGLQAQALLDRRAEKAADRDLTLNMARLLSGAIMMTPTTVIESRAVEIREIGDGLAPEGVYEPVT